MVGRTNSYSTWPRLGPTVEPGTPRNKPKSIVFENVFMCPKLPSFTVGTSPVKRPDYVAFHFSLTIWPHHCRYVVKPVPSVPAPVKKCINNSISTIVTWGRPGTGQGISWAFELASSVLILKFCINYSTFVT